MVTQAKHSERAHAVLSASSANRWMNCTPSARMSEGMPSSTSVHAEKGTLAHEISENELRYRLGIINRKKRNLNLLNLKRKRFEGEPLYDVEMDYPIEDYVNFVMEQVAEARAASEDAMLLIEEKFDLTEFIPDGFGTGDFTAVSDGVLYITDLKFGKGVRVSAVDNAQLKIYGLGGLDAFGMLYDIHTVRLTIVQPRLDAISTWDIDAEELLEWGETELTDLAEVAFAGKGEPVTGSWCKFCKAKTVCEAQKTEALMMAEQDFKKPANSEQDQELVDVYMQAANLRDYLDTVEQHIMETALKGKKWPGLKLVEGRGRRTITDQAAAMKALKADGVSKNLYEETKTSTKLYSLGNLKKHIGKDRLERVLGPYITKSAGKPTIVEDSDDRPELNRASDFAD